MEPPPQSVKVEPSKPVQPAQRVSIVQETSQTRQNTNGFNVSYDNSFSAIKTNIFNFKGGQTTLSAPAQDINVTAEEKPNKPRDPTHDKAERSTTPMNLTLEVNLNNITQLTDNEPLNKTVTTKTAPLVQPKSSK